MVARRDDLGSPVLETSTSHSSGALLLILRTRVVINFMACFLQMVVVVVLGFYVSPTAKVIRRRDLGLKSHPKDWSSPGSNSRPLD